MFLKSKKVLFCLQESKIEFKKYNLHYKEKQFITIFEKKVSSWNFFHWIHVDDEVIGHFQWPMKWSFPNETVPIINVFVANGLLAKLIITVMECGDLEFFANNTVMFKSFFLTRRLTIIKWFCFYTKNIDLNKGVQSQMNNNV